MHTAARSFELEWARNIFLVVMGFQNYFRMTFIAMMRSGFIWKNTVYPLKARLRMIGTESGTVRGVRAMATASRYHGV
jgi:hypothetical protein